jgi:hypothetical protein
LERQLILAQETGKPADSSGKSATRSSLPIIILIVVLALAAIGVGVGVEYSSGSTHYSCFTFTQQGSTLDVVTNGIIHISSSQYYVVCPEGAPDPQTGTSVSCLTISPQVKTFAYPDSQFSVWYYLSAPGHTITIPSAIANSTEILQPTNVTIQVSC